MGAVYKVLNFYIQAYYDCYHYKKKADWDLLCDSLIEMHHTLYCVSPVYFVLSIIKCKSLALLCLSQ